MSRILLTIASFSLTLLLSSCELDLCGVSDSCRSPANTNMTESPSLAPPPETVNAKTRGIRLDPSYFYNSHSGQSTLSIATDVVNQIKVAGANTIYLYAYNSEYGAYYPTTYAQTAVEQGYGQLNIFGAISTEAKIQGLKVVAVVPLNNFKTVWQNNTSWRVKESADVDYIPGANTYLLSASVNDYKSWYEGFLTDLVTNNPNIDGIEAVEPNLDYNWSGAPDQNAAALSAFNALHPLAAIGSQEWFDFRANEFLDLIRLFNQTVHSLNKETFLVQTWSINANGTLMNANYIKNATGFDFIGVATLSGTAKTDFLTSEFIWQQWSSEYGSTLFDPEWIANIGATYINILEAAGSTSEPILHIEITPFTGTHSSVAPSLSEFERTLISAKTLNTGISVYDYNQILTQSAFTQLSKWVP